MTVKKIASVLIAVLLLVAAVALGGCSKEKEKTMLDYNIGLYSEPEQGEEIAVMHTDKGDLYIRFFPEAAPKAVENFKTHAKNGYYNGMIFHRVIEDFMIQSGDPQGTGYGGESIWGNKFADEFSADAHNFYGALSMANSGTNSNASQFFIVQAKSVSASLLSQMKDYPSLFSTKVINTYSEHGGTPWLDNKHTVFGFVFCGMEVADAIAAVRTVDPNNGNNKPVKDVHITSVEIIPYSGVN